MIQRIIALFGALALALVLVACSAGPSAGSQPSGSGGGGDQIAVKMTDMKFEPSTLNLNAGQTYRINLSNAGAVPHDFTIEGADKPITVLLDPGKSGTAEVAIAKAATYKLVCKQPGHEAAGMVGSVVVK